jgi:hypothetical protein
MTVREPAAPAPPRPFIPPTPLSAPKAPPLVDAPPAPAVPADDPPTWVPAVGGWMVVAFFGQPESSAVPASKQAIAMIRFIVSSVQSSWVGLGWAWGHRPKPQLCT